MRMFKFFNGLQGGFALALEKNKVGLLFSILLYLFRLLIKTIRFLSDCFTLNLLLLLAVNAVSNTTQSMLFF